MEGNDLQRKESEPPVAPKRLKVISVLDKVSDKSYGMKLNNISFVLSQN